MSEWQPIKTAPRDTMIILCMYPHPGFNESPMKIGGWWDGKWNIFGGSWARAYSLDETPKAARVMT